MASKSKASPPDLTSYLGTILWHLLSLDFLMRNVIDQKKSGDSLNYKYFSRVLKKYNSLVQINEKVNPELIKLRNALAHGVISYPVPSSDSLGTLIKYKPGEKTIEFKEELTEEWLSKQISETKDELMKVANVSGADIVSHIQ